MKTQFANSVTQMPTNEPRPSMAATTYGQEGVTVKSRNETHTSKNVASASLSRFVRQLMIVVVGGLFFSSIAVSAFAAQNNCADVPTKCGFGKYVLPGRAPDSPLSAKNPKWSASLETWVYLNKNKNSEEIYTYVYRLELDPNSAAIAYIRLLYKKYNAEENATSFQPFDKRLDWGIIRDKNGEWTSKNVDDCGDTGGKGCQNNYQRGFTFSKSSFAIYCAFLGPTEEEPLRITFYAQSKLRPAPEKDGETTVAGWKDKESSSDFYAQLVATAPFQFLTTKLPDGRVGLGYGNFHDGFGLYADGGYEPYSWSIAGGNLPNGLQLDAKTGVISGTPTAPGVFNFSVQVQDSETPPVIAARELKITVLPQ